MEVTGEKTTGDLLDWMELTVHLQHKRVIELQPPSCPHGYLHGLEIKRKVNFKYIFLLPTKPKHSGNAANDHFSPHFISCSVN